MNAIVTGITPIVDIGSNGRLNFTVLYYGAPLDLQRQSTVTVEFVANDTANTLGAKLNAAVDAEGRRLTADLPGGAVAPATTLAPSYIKLR